MEDKKLIEFLREISEQANNVNHGAGVGVLRSIDKFVHENKLNILNPADRVSVWDENGVPIYDGGQVKSYQGKRVRGTVVKHLGNGKEINKFNLNEDYAQVIWDDEELLDHPISELRFESTKKPELKTNK